jgi:hypothetical protein
MAEHNQNKYYPESRRWHCEKVCGDVVFGVIFQESAPGL